MKIEITLRQSTARKICRWLQEEYKRPGVSLPDLVKLHLLTGVAEDASEKAAAAFQALYDGAGNEDV